MTETRLFVLLLSAAFGLLACESPAAGGAEHEADVMAWRAERMASLSAEDGFLNLAGLFWLEPGEASFGSAAGNDIVFPPAAAAQIGRFRVDDDGVQMEVLPGVDVSIGGDTVRDAHLADDTTDAPVTARHRSLAWLVIRRGDRFAIRLRDFEHPSLTNFPPLEYYPIDADYRVDAIFHEYETPRVAHFDTVVAGLGWDPTSPGVVRFEIDGVDYELEGYESGDELFFVFGDRTNGRETYPAGRFLYAARPGSGGRTVLDFNRAYSPPCAFNDFATCPVAAPRNRLPVRIEAGELFDRHAHAVPEGY